VRFDDIDVNEHVNNSVYPLWASESVDCEFRKTHTPAEIELCFKKEAIYGEKIAVLTAMSGDESNHVICDKETEDELALCRIKWRNVTS
jgi:acyl-ACP thioesterase